MNMQPWLDSLLKQLTDLDPLSMFRKALGMAYKVLLAGFTIGFAFTTYLILAGLGLEAVGTWGTALVLWISLEYLYRDPLFVFAGSLYLILVTSVGVAAMAARLPIDLVMPTSIQTPTLYLLGLLTVVWLFKLGKDAILRAFRGKGPFGEKQPNAPDDEATVPITPVRV